MSQKETKADQILKALEGHDQRLTSIETMLKGLQPPESTEGTGHREEIMRDKGLPSFGEYLDKHVPECPTCQKDLEKAGYKKAPPKPPPKPKEGGEGGETKPSNQGFKVGELWEKEKTEG